MISRTDYTAGGKTSQEGLLKVLPKSFTRSRPRYAATFFLRSSTKHPHKDNGDRQDSLLRFHFSRWSFSSQVHSLV